MKIKKGDKVKVITGHDKGVVGEVLACSPKENRIVVEGVNIRKVAQKPSQLNPDGGIINRECPIHVSNVVLTDQKKDKKTKKEKTEKKSEDKKKKGGKK